MAQRITVPGIGVVNFPDDMDDDAIAAAIQKNLPPPPGARSAAGAAKATGAGIAEGLTELAGLPGDARKIAGAATDFIGGKLGASPEAVDRFKTVAQKVGSYLPFGQQFANNPGSQELLGNVKSVTGEFYQPQNVEEEYLKTGGKFLPAAAAGPGGIVRRVLAQALMPAVASETAGQATKGTAAEPYARFGGAVAGAALPAALARVVNPLQPSAQRTALARVLRDEGVDVSAGQVTGSPMLRAMENPFGGNNERQLEQLTAAAMRRAGETGGRAASQDVDRMLTRIGGEADRLAANNTLIPDRQLSNELMASVGGYNNLVSPPNRAPIISQFMKEIGEAVAANNGDLPGAVYQSLRSRMEQVARSAGRNEVSTALRGMKDALDSAMERSMAAAGSPDLGAWQEMRRQYRNALPIADASVGGEMAGQGLLTPGKLSQAVTTRHGKMNRARGRGEFSELADAADALLRPLPNSGTPVRAAAAAIPAALGGIVGAGTPLGPILGPLVGAALAGGAIKAPPVQAYLAGRIPGQGLVTNQSSTAARDALAQALLRSMIPVQ
jgi:hypothetical protein